MGSISDICCYTAADSSMTVAALEAWSYDQQPRRLQVFLVPPKPGTIDGDESEEPQQTTVNDEGPEKHLDVETGRGASEASTDDATERDQAAVPPSPDPSASAEGLEKKKHGGRHLVTAKVMAHAV